MDYLAVFEKDGAKSSIYLTRDSQIEEFLAQGAEIYRGEDGEDIDDMELIATPEDGLLIERPVFPVVESVNIQTK